MLVLMMTTPEGGGATRRRFRQRFPPPISVGSGLLTPFLCVFDLRRRAFTIRIGGTLYSLFLVKMSRWHENWSETGFGGPKDFGGHASPSLLLFPAPFASFKSSMSSVSKILKRGLWFCSIPSPVAPENSKILTEGLFCQIELKPDKRGLFRKSPKSLRSLVMSTNMMQICGNMWQ